jgi:hypothetical protein
MIRPHLIQVAGEFVFANIGVGWGEGSGFTTKEKSFSIAGNP